MSFEAEERRRDYLLKIISILAVLTGKNCRFFLENTLKGGKFREYINKSNREWSYPR